MGKMPVIGIAGLLVASATLCGCSKNCCGTGGSQVASGHASTMPRNGAVGTQNGTALTSNGQMGNTAANGLTPLGGQNGNTMGRSMASSNTGTPNYTGGMSNTQPTYTGGNAYSPTYNGNSTPPASGGYNSTGTGAITPTGGSSQFRAAPSGINTPAYDTSSVPGRVRSVETPLPSSGSGLGTNPGPLPVQPAPVAAPLPDATPGGSQSKYTPVSGNPPSVAGVPAIAPLKSGPPLSEDPE